MTDVQERRKSGTERRPVSTLVEVCANVPGIPVFEAESIDVSPRGMHLKTAYLPEMGAPLVCRFENDGGEIVVEGVVAWRRESTRGGEFGIQFTALDSRSVDALRELCGHRDSDRGDTVVGEPGARVRLHIDGLGSPMKARVRVGGRGKVQVGSNLEFLKVGRRLEVEDLDQGARRNAQIDGVSVLIDPSTQIPQLVVGLRYDGAEDDTPSPVTAHAVTPQHPEPRAVRLPASSVTMGSAEAVRPKEPARADEKPAGAREDKAVSREDNAAAASTKAETARDDKAPETTKAASDEQSDDSPALRGKLASIAANAEVHAKAAGEKLAEASTTAARGAAHWMKIAGGKIAALRKNGASAAKRTTSPPPASAEKPKLRTQASGGTNEAENSGGARRSLSKRGAIIAGAVALATVSGAAIAMRSPAAPPPGAVAGDAASSTAGTPPSADDGGSRDGRGAVTATVPLFGPTALTTTEPAPLGPPPELSEEAREMRAAKATLQPSAEEDEAFEDEPPARKSTPSDKRAKSGGDSSERAVVRPEDVPTWGRGRMHLPTIHRLRLDAPGAALQGAAEPTGFTIVVPDRKVMEAAAGIAKRDERIARVRATNIGAGAQVTFRFKDGVPGYRVRLRRDYIEFLVSAPEKRASEKGEKTASKSSR